MASEDEKIKVPTYSKKNGFIPKDGYSKKLSRVTKVDSKPEVTFRKQLFKLGFRYRVNSKAILGTPDIVFTRHKLVIFIDGDFWHGYNWETRKAKLKTNLEYWIPKIERNMQRDAEVSSTLAMQGWNVIRLWEHEIKKDVEKCLDRVISSLTLLSLKS